MSGGEFMGKSISTSFFLLLIALLSLSPQWTFSRLKSEAFSTTLYRQGAEEETLPIANNPRSGTLPAPPAGGCLLSPVQYEFSVREGECEPVELHYAPLLRANQNVKLYVRFGQRVALENDAIIADFAASSGEALQRSVPIGAISNPPLRAGKYFIAISNCGPGAADFTLTLIHGLVDYFTPIRIITRAEIEGRQLLVYGCFPKKGAKLLLNGVPQ